MRRSTHNTNWPHPVSPFTSLQYYWDLTLLETRLISAVTPTYMRSVACSLVANGCAGGYINAIAEVSKGKVAFSFLMPKAARHASH